MADPNQSSVKKAYPGTEVPLPVQYRILNLAFLHFRKVSPENILLGLSGGGTPKNN